jgi:hypothetical protein
MIKVYFEDKRYRDLELVAIFASEELFQLCKSHLEVQASLTNLTVTASIEEEDLSDKF